MFTTKFSEILEKVAKIRPTNYGKTRNYVDGAVTRVSPYISRGVISTKYVFEMVMEKGYKRTSVEKFIQELLWRDYWQQVWIAKGNAINEDLKKPQDKVAHFEVPKAIVGANTGIVAIDRAINEFYKTGYLHNHIRMYIAALACNVAGSHWKIPAKWMYYHLLDADWASNALSWQWVAGSNSHKKYYANQDNINTYCYTNQKGSFLDVSYEALVNMPIPEALSETLTPALHTILPPKKSIRINAALPTCIYNFYNLDPLWKKDSIANRVFLLEPSHFEQYPIALKTIAFILELAKNIKDIQIYTGEFNDLYNTYPLKDVYYKEHPLNQHYIGTEEPRDWIVEEVKGYHPSFFSYWKKCSKRLPGW